jgi:hypothetical protein
LNFCFLDKTPNDLERETTLLEQLVRLAEERNFAEFPPPGSGIPGKEILLKIILF